MKKALAVLCAICLLIGATTIVASAAAPEEGRPANYVQFIDFSQWTEEMFAKFDSKGDWGSIRAEADENGLLNVICNNNHWTEYLAPFVDLGVYDDESGDLTGAQPGCNISLFKESAQIPSDSTDAGICFYIDLTDWDLDDGESQTELRIGFYDLDFKEDGSKNMSKGKQLITDRRTAIKVPLHFKGWVQVPFADMSINDNDANGMVDMVTMPSLMVYCNGPQGTDQIYRLGDVGFFGPKFQPEYQTEGYQFIAGEKMPEDCVVLVDNSKVKTDDGINDGFVVDKEDSKCNIADGFINITWTPANGGWWFQNGLDTHMIDDETGDLGDALPGFTTKLDYEYDSTSDKCGLAFYVDTTELTEVNDPFWFDIYVQEAGEKDADGNALPLKKGHEIITTFHVKGFMPIGYKGWIKVPFNKIVQDQWGDQAWDSANVDGKFNADNIVKVTYVASIYGEDAGDAESVTMRVGNLAVWGEGISKVQPEPEKPVEPETSNPDSGVSAATGIASGLAIAALAVAAAVCFRKKED